MVVNIITPDDLQSFKAGFLEELVQILEQQKTTSARKYLKAHEVCRLLKISPRTLHRYRADGSLPYTRIRGTYYYDNTDIQRLIEENKIQQPRRGQLLPGEPTRKRTSK
jgi:hypothetical protein